MLTIHSLEAKNRQVTQGWATMGVNAASGVLYFSK
jgi:hypothetical protein